MAFNSFPAICGCQATRAVILDLYSRRVVGFALSTRIDEDLALAALRVALVTRRPAPGLIHHFDRGSPDCGHSSQREL